MTSPAPSFDCDVLITGGGPVGLFLACELGAHGLSVELYEKEPGTSVHPKANTHSARSLELYRRHGVTAPFRRAGWPATRTADIVYCTRILGHELGRVEMPSPEEALAAAAAGSSRWPTPEPQLRSSQLQLEPLLLERARSFERVKLAFASEVIRFEEVEGGVRVEVLGRPGHRTRRGRFLVACDGARGTTRGQLGVSFAGEGGLDLDFMGGTMVTTYFRAPTLLGLVPGRSAWQFWTLNPERRNLVVSLDGIDLFVLHHQLPPGQALEDFDFSAALTAVVGRAIPHQLISASPWRAGRALVAGHYGAGHVALAGDAAHLFTPTGGLGVNTGIEDAANLAWKLAAALGGWAGPGLLPSYESERRPIAERNTRFALSLAKAVSACPIGPELEADSEAGVRARAAAHRHIEAVAHHEFDHPGLQLGSRYDDAGLVFADAARPSRTEPQLAYQPEISPGGRLPHHWIAPGESTLDLCGHRFTLLSFDQPDARAAALVAEADRRGIPLAHRVLERPLLVQELGVSHALVRPDQVVAWTDVATGVETTPGAIFDVVTGQRAPGKGSFDLA